MAVLPLFAGWRRLPAVIAALAVSSALAADPAKTAADYFVRSLPGAPEGPLIKMHAGYDMIALP